MKTPMRVLAGLVVLAGCTSYSPSSLAPGSSIDDARKSMGPPSGDYPLADGKRRVEYARGPFGKHTYMLDFDAQGRLESTQQVLEDRNFNAILAGMKADDVLRRIGHPSETFLVGWQKEKQTVWAYRYDSPFCVWFQVGLDPRGNVMDTAYGPDPACEVHDPF